MITRTYFLEHWKECSMEEILELEEFCKQRLKEIPKWKEYWWTKPRKNLQKKGFKISKSERCMWDDELLLTIRTLDLIDYIKHFISSVSKKTKDL